MSADHRKLLEDARRYRALRPYLHIASGGPKEWTCWLHLDCIPWRLPPGEDNPDVLVDKIADKIDAAMVKP